MDEAAAVRRAALGAVGDVAPPAFQDNIKGFVADGSLMPGVVTLATAAAAGAVTDAQTDRAAGVQLIYDGLRLTRSLARENPWDADADGEHEYPDTDGGKTEADADIPTPDRTGRGNSDAEPSGLKPVEFGTQQPETTSANVAILAADVLVARGFYLLADTDAAVDAVEVVRAFGRDESERRTVPAPERFDRELEADVLRLALVAGATANGGRPANTESLVADLASTWDGTFPEPGEVVDDHVRERLTNIAAGAGRPLNRND